jgi:hypothetical protein
MAMKQTGMTAYHGPQRCWPLAQAPLDSERIKRIEKETALHLALNSDNPTVIDATERLLVAVRLAHGEDFAAKRREIRDAVDAMRAGYEEEEAERERERRREAQERDYRRVIARTRYVIGTMAGIAAGFLLLVATRG